jgi:hypothetical protein
MKHMDLTIWKDDIQLEQPAIPQGILLSRDAALPLL